MITVRLGSCFDLITCSPNKDSNIGRHRWDTSSHLYSWRHCVHSNYIAWESDVRTVLNVARTYHKVIIVWLNYMWFLIHIKTCHLFTSHNMPSVSLLKNLLYLYGRQLTQLDRPQQLESEIKIHIPNLQLVLFTFLLPFWATRHVSIWNHNLQDFHSVRYVT